MYKLIIVEDELLMRVGIRSMLNWEEHGFCVAGEASNGREALEMALEKAPDLIITDIKMPVMDGLQLIQEASNVIKHCKYVILSNFDELHYVKRALKLGAADYLIKSEINEHSLIQLLETIREKLQSEQKLIHGFPPASADYSKSLRYLKDSFFQDIVSGFISNHDMLLKAEELQFRIQSDDLVVIKFIVNHVEQVKRKYIEKGEKLLRFSILNIMEEVIPSRWAKEIFVESSAEYWVVVNAGSSVESDVKATQTDLDKLIRKIMSSLKDFMNLSLTAGVSSVVPDFTMIRRACQEAEAALEERFFAGAHPILHVQQVREQPGRQEVVIMLNTEQEQRFKKICVSQNKEGMQQFMDEIRSELLTMQADESSVRKQYIVMMETMHAHLLHVSSRSKLPVSRQSPYEIVLYGECWHEIHNNVVAHMLDTFHAYSQSAQELSYTDLAIDLIHKYYAEDISLQSAASQINVNPSYLSRLFKQEKGENFISYLTRVRIEHAKAYLLNRELKVYEIADKVGYHNYTYFSKIFKKNAGLTPEEYREQQHMH
ncbi:response regulator [Paenibacillus sp. TC-CSREp1]|uniref:response regulator n=1 Tax=Paenibacillus sp. TC-CSREp1 TaxID=3410089 RepID=UPI003CF86CC9